ncbi:MAG: nitroreductase [Alphaproteobacteria bacterium]|nr:nitroreductase [Alphaproteobacteria bacterium]MCB9697356.1 nitroreductase [Alphaproteobacteria bacterium]
MSTVHDVIASRRTIQRFRPGTVPDEVLERALLAAQHAPNHKLTWPWRFVLPGPVTRELLFRVGLRIKSARKGPSAELEASVRRNMLVPDRLVVVVQRVDAEPARAEEDYAACACAVQNLMLSLHADGFGSKWGTGGTLRDPEAREALGLHADESAIAFVWIGLPEIVPTPPPRPVDRVTHLP